MVKIDKFVKLVKILSLTARLVKTLLTKAALFDDSAGANSFTN
jgi:hypothetical protein